MAIRLKTRDQIEQMRIAGTIVRRALQRIGEMMVPGLTTEEMDAEAQRICSQAHGKCLFKGVPGRGNAGPFPGNICASLNEEVVHGIPSDRQVKTGDIIGIDFGVEVDGWCGDACNTFIVGEVDEKVRRLVSVTENSLALAIGMCTPGMEWSNVAGAMQDYVESEGFSVVRDFVGHGIGSDMHEDPKVPNFASRGRRSQDFVLAEGMVLAIEPMVNMGSAGVEYAADGWTVVTRDRLPSAHFEHTVAIMADGAEVLTAGS